MTVTRIIAYTMRDIISDVKKTVFFQIVFFLPKKKQVLKKKKTVFYPFFVFLKYGININTQVETTLLWDLFSIYDTVSNYFTSLLLSAVLDSKVCILIECGYMGLWSTKIH